ncbi:MAG: DUF1003 domain-containing protein [Myxococcales bacterium]|nr:DUF1003 domain-containing protein [Myxococcales bacterium]
MSDRKERAPCLICTLDFERDALTPFASLRTSLADFIAERHPDPAPETRGICRSCLDGERVDRLQQLLEDERGALTGVEREVAHKAALHQAIVDRVDDEDDERSFGQRLADNVASVGGSWPFVIGFGLVLVTWIVINSLLLRGGAFDPYPYILLNLMLSCLAAVQAPIIMMSQNRSTERDRAAAAKDYKVNLKAEIEVAMLHDKMDHVIRWQFQRLAALEQGQLDIMAELERLGQAKR